MTILQKLSRAARRWTKEKPARVSLQSLQSLQSLTRWKTLPKSANRRFRRFRWARLTTWKQTAGSGSRPRWTRLTIPTYLSVSHFKLANKGLIFVFLRQPWQRRLLGIHFVNLHGDFDRYCIFPRIRHTFFDFWSLKSRVRLICGYKSQKSLKNAIFCNNFKNSSKEAPKGYV